MFSRHVSRQLAAYIDGELLPARTEQVELHLLRCAHCRSERERVKSGIESLELLPSAAAPDAIWASIEAALRERATLTTAGPRRWRWAFAAIALSAALGGGVWTVAHHSGTRWEVMRSHGAGTVGAGEWIETDAKSSVTVKIGVIGSVEVTPNTRLRVLAARPDEHRLALARGKIRAKISAPPRLFFVETASGTAVDLGCEYTLSTDEAGLGLLRVTKGWVSFDWQGLESLVPAGASCKTRPGAGPGIPCFEDASDSMKQALDRFGFEKDGNATLNVILAEARVRDTLTLWHLLSRVSIEDRGRVFDRIASLTLVPAGVSRAEALQLDPETLKRWKEELAWTW